MKLRNVYYLEQPENLICDSICARILTEPEKGEEGGYEYSIEITTIEYIKKWLSSSKEKYYNNSCGEPIYIVKSLDEETIDKIIKDIMPNIDKIALRID